MERQIHRLKPAQRAEFLEELENLTMLLASYPHMSVLSDDEIQRLAKIGKRLAKLEG